MTCNIYIYKLFRIGNRQHELEESYIQQKSGRYSSQELGIAIDILSDLDRVFEDLPEFLKPGGYVPACRYRDSFEMLANTLRARSVIPTYLPLIYIHNADDPPNTKGHVSPPLALTAVPTSGDTKENGTQRALVRSSSISLRASQPAAQG